MEHLLDGLSNKSHLQDGSIWVTLTLGWRSKLEVEGFI
jgi:hypothetical protein